jgi:hypothetical protein
MKKYIVILGNEKEMMDDREKKAQKKETLSFYIFLF